jgi:hypothetical protein
MGQPVALTDIVAFLASFRQVFTAPAFYYFQQFVRAFWLAGGRRTTTQVYRFACSPKHFSNFHRFLASYRWSAPQLGVRLREVVLRHLGVEAPAEGRRWLAVALDDTLKRKFGRKMEGAGWQYAVEGVSGCRASRRRLVSRGLGDPGRKIHAGNAPPPGQGSRPPNSRRQGRSLKVEDSRDPFPHSRTSEGIPRPLRQLRGGRVQ